MPSQAQSHLRYPLTSLLGSPGNVRVLRALFVDRAPLSVARIAGLAGLTPQGTRRVLDALVRQRVVIAHGSGRAQLYALSFEHPFAEALCGLFSEDGMRWDALLDAVRETLGRHGSAVAAAWLYGSVARGEDTPGSDVDIAMLVRSRGVADRIREELMPLEDRQQLRISLTALTPGDLASLPEDDPWWLDVVRDGRVLKGPPPDQARRRVAKASA